MFDLIGTLPDGTAPTADRRETPALLSRQRRHRIEARRVAGRHVAEGDADHGRGHDGDDNRCGRIDQPKSHIEGVEQRAEAEREADPQRAADQAHQHGLDQELLQDIGLAGADRHPHADLADALGDRHQHDVHHADPADDQRDHRDGGDQQRQDLGGALDGAADVVGVEDEEVLAVVALRQETRDRLLGNIGRGGIADADADAAQRSVSEKTRLHRGVGQIDRGIGAGTETALLRAGDADDAAGHAPDQHNTTDGACRAVGKQRLARVVVDHRILGVAADAVRIDEAALGELSALDLKILLADAADLRAGLDRTEPERARRRHRRRHGGHIRLLRQHARIREHQGLDLAGAGVAEIPAGKDLEGVGAEAVDIGEHPLLRARAQRNHADHRHHADDDAEHGQERAQTMGIHRQQSHAQRFAKAAPSRVPA